MLSSLEKAKQNGATIVAIHPLPEAGLLQQVGRRPAGAAGLNTQVGAEA